MALRPGGKVKKRPGPTGSPLPTQKPGRGRPKPGSKAKGPAGGPKPKPSTIKPKLGLPPVKRKARGGMLKGIIRIPPLPKPQLMPRSGVISTIDRGMRKPRPAEKFVRIRERINKLGGYAMGGEASTSLSRAELAKKNRDRRRKETQEMLERLYGAEKPKIVPKKKPPKKKDGGEIKERIQKFKMKMNPQDFDLKTGARLTEKDKTDRMRRSRDKLKSKPKRKMFQ